MGQGSEMVDEGSMRSRAKVATNETNYCLSFFHTPLQGHEESAYQAEKSGAKEQFLIGRWQHGQLP